MPQGVRRAFDSELTTARTAAADADRWIALERAHILSQPWAWPHVRCHALMLRLALRQRDGREAAGQVLRTLVAGPGSITARYPVGNTGRARVPATLPMAIPDDLARLLDAPST